MELYIHDKTRNLYGIIENFEYLRWTRRYCNCGSFELKAPVTAENACLLQMGHFLRKKGDTEIAVIETIILTGSEQEYITVSGRFATSFLARRIVWGTEKIRDTISDAIHGLLQNHMLNPTDSKRAIGGFEYSGLDRTPGIVMQTSYDNLMEVCYTIAEIGEYGIRTDLVPVHDSLSDLTFAVLDEKTFAQIDSLAFGGSPGLRISLYTGTEVQGIFSKEFENILDQIFTVSVANFANTTLIGGEGEGSARQFRSILAGSGENRYEVFTDAKDIKSEDFPNDYTEALLSRGLEKLSEKSIVRSFEITINPYGNLRYRQDFDLGDRITAQSRKWGVELTARLTEIEESYDTNGLSLNLTLGKPFLTAVDLLKKI